MAAKIPRADNRYYKEHLEPLVDGDQIRLLGEVDDRGKGDDPLVEFVGEIGDGEKEGFLGGAAALLMPIGWSRSGWS